MAKLVGMSIEETSGVDHPAHLREGWMVMKSAELADLTEVIDQIKAATSATESTEDAMSDATPEIDLEAELVKANNRIAELEAALTPEPVIEETEEDLLKSVPESVRKMIDDQRAVAAEAIAKAATFEAELRKERETAADVAAIAKAAEWTALTLDASEVGPALRRLSDIDANLAKAIETVLDAANAQAESAGIFSEIGKAGRPEGSDAYEALSSLAKSSAETNGTTFEAAFVAVAEQNPDLYIRHLSEKGA
jgi:hypothetical protein